MKLNLRVWRQHDAGAAGRFVTYQVDGVTPCNGDGVHPGGG